MNAEVQLFEGAWPCVTLTWLQDLDSDEPELSDWVCYAAEEYEILVAEEGASDVQREDWWVAPEPLPQLAELPGLLLWEDLHFCQFHIISFFCIFFK